MSRIITLDIDSTAIHALSGVAYKGNAKLEKAATMPLALPLGLGNAAEVGKNLREFLKSKGMSAPQALICVGKDRVILKEIKYPPVPDTEEANIVRFQVSKELTEAADSVVIDYSPLEGVEPDGQKKALTVVLKKDYLEAIRVLCENAGMKPIGIVPRSFALAGLMQRTFASGAVIAPQNLQTYYAVLTRGDKWGEMAIYKGTQAVFARSLTNQAMNSENAFLGEVKRNLTVFAGQSPQTQVESLYLPEADQSGTWGGRLRAGLNFPVQPFDPLAGLPGDTNPRDRGNYAGLVGALALQASKAGLPVNFISPRQPVFKKDPNKRGLVMAAMIFGFLLLGGMIVGYTQVLAKSREVAELRGELDGIQARLNAVKKDRERAKAISDWRDHSVNFLDELYDLTARFPNIDGTRLRKVTFIQQEMGKGQLKYPVKLTMDLVTEGISEVNKLIVSMSNDSNHYQAEKATGGGFNSSDPRRILKFTVVSNVSNRKPADYVAKLVADPPPVARGGRTGEGFGGGFGGFGFPGGNP